MLANLIIKYVYGGHKGDDPKGDDQKGAVHQISQQKISKYLKDVKPQNILKYPDIVELLKSDGAQFYPNSVRYYDPNAETYIRMEKDFIIELNRSSNWLSSDTPLVLRLWIKDANFVLRSKITALSHRVKQLEQTRNTVPMIVTQRQDSGGLSLAALRHTTGSPAINATYSPSIQDVGPKSLIIIDDSPQRRKISEYNLNETSNFPLAGNLKLDIAIMYAEPLAQINGRATLSLTDAVNYEEECSKIYETLESKELKIHLAIEIASRENLVKVLSRNPVILHILCHGEYDKVQKKFYLCFENSDGELDPFYADDLRSILSKYDTNVKLVFVNACHSEAVASVFADAGVPCVVAVQSQLQIADAIARKFANEFYHFIFDGHKIGEAFDNALLASRSKDSRSCCCGHQHKPDCNWYKMALKGGFSYAHLFHDPLCLDCPKKSEHIHKQICPWATDFMMKFGPDGWDANLKGEFQSCCCSPELAHDEALKFIIVTKDPEVRDNLVLYQPKEPGRILFRKQNSIIEKKFPVERLIGRNKLMYDLFKILRGPQRLVQLIGKPGVGKTVLAKQIANYLHARNHFTNKIAIIEMDRFYSLSSFLSELYSEEEYVNDLKGFCEAMKSKDALFILEKCDTFFQTNRKEFFSQINQIIESTSNVRFIFIFNQTPSSYLNLAKIEVGNLYPTDAAKLLLINTPLHKIPFKYRNVEDLKHCELFKQYQTISPQIILSISTSLINGQNFDKIQRELLKNPENFSEDNQSELAIEKTLKEIQEQNTQGFSLIMKLGIFPGGLLSLDLKELVKLDLISDDWKTILSSLFPKYNEEVAFLESPIKMQGTRGQQPLSRQTSKLTFPFTEPVPVPVSMSTKASKSKPRFTKKKSTLVELLSVSTGDFLWIQISKIPSMNGLLFKPTQAANEFLMREFQQEIRLIELVRKQYLTLISLSLLGKMRSLSVYHERLLENSAFCKHGLWAIAEDNSFYQKFIKEKAFMLSYLDNPDVKSAKDIQNIYNIHEPNLSSSLRTPYIKSMISNLETRKETLDVIEILWFATLTLYKIFSKNPEAVISFASKILGILNELDVKGSQIALLKIKLHLFIVGIIIKQRRSDTINTENEFKSEVKLINEWKSEITDKDVIERITFEIEFARAYLLYRQKKGRLNPKIGGFGGDEGQKRSQDIVKILKDSCDKILGKLEYQTDIDRAKVVLLLSKVQILTNKGMVDETLKERLFKGVKEFQRSTSPKLALQACYSIGSLHLQYFIQKGLWGSKISSIVEESEQLDKIKHHYLKQEALSILKTTNDSHWESKINQLIDEINSLIRQNLFNMITLLHAFPNNQELQSLEPDSLKHQIKIPNFFKSDILQSLGEIGEKGKNLSLKFEILTEDTFRAALDTGSRILYIGSEVVHPDGIVMEKVRGGSALYPYHEIRRLMMGLMKKKQQTSGSGSSDIEMAIVGSKNDENLANFLTQDLHIKHVIYFKFNRQKSQDCYREKLYEDVFVKKFIQFYLNELVCGKSVQSSFHIALQFTINCVADSFFNSDAQEANEYMAPGAILLPDILEVNSHDEKLFGVENRMLLDGKPEDISTRRPPSNIRKTLLPFFGRVSETEAVVSKVLSESSSNNQFIKIQGLPGVGKTRFVLELGYYLLQRGCFKDGIFYIPLRRLKNMTFFELLEKTINPQALGQRITKNIQSFFRDKEILLIFDDFDLFYSEQIEFPSFIFPTLKRSQVKVIVTCTKYNMRGKMNEAQKEIWERFKKNQETKEAEYVGDMYALDPLENEHLAHLVVALSDSSVNGVNEKQVLKHTRFSQVRGIPRILIKKLSEKKFIFKDKPLEVNSYLDQYLYLDKRYGHILKFDEDPICRENLHVISRFCKDFIKFSRQFRVSDTDSISLKRDISSIRSQFDYKLTPPNTSKEEVERDGESEKIEEMDDNDDGSIYGETNLKQSIDDETEKNSENTDKEELEEDVVKSINEEDKIGMK